MIVKNKTALITGGARIGLVVAEELAKRGCDVAMTYVSSKKLVDDTKEIARRYGVRAMAFKADMTKNAAVKKLYGDVKRAFSRLDIVVNMASVYEQVPASSLDEKSWDRLIDSNLKATYLSVLHATPLLKKSGGRVINFSDWIAASGRPRYKNFLPYFAAKSGIVGLTQAQALELAPTILVNAIAPGPILPPTDLKNEETKEIAKVTPLGRWGGAGEIAKAVLFLCETDFVTGECIRVDGGRHLF